MNKILIIILSLLTLNAYATNGLEKLAEVNKAYKDASSLALEFSVNHYRTSVNGAKSLEYQVEGTVLISESLSYVKYDNTEAVVGEEFSILINNDLKRIQVSQLSKEEQFDYGTEEYSMESLLNQLQEVTDVHEEYRCTENEELLHYYFRYSNSYLLSTELVIDPASNKVLKIIETYPVEEDGTSFYTVIDYSRVEINESLSKAPFMLSTYLVQVQGMLYPSKNYADYNLINVE